MPNSPLTPSQPSAVTSQISPNLSLNVPISELVKIGQAALLSAAITASPSSTPSGSQFQSTAMPKKPQGVPVGQGKRKKAARKEAKKPLKSWTMKYEHDGLTDIDLVAHWMTDIDNFNKWRKGPNMPNLMSKKQVGEEVANYLLLYGHERDGDGCEKKVSSFNPLFQQDLSTLSLHVI